MITKPPRSDHLNQSQLQDTRACWASMICGTSEGNDSPRPMMVADQTIQGKRRPCKNQRRYRARQKSLLSSARRSQYSREHQTAMVAMRPKRTIGTMVERNRLKE